MYSFVRVCVLKFNVIEVEYILDAISFNNSKLILFSSNNSCNCFNISILVSFVIKLVLINNNKYVYNSILRILSCVFHIIIPFDSVLVYHINNIM